MSVSVLLISGLIYYLIINHIARQQLDNDLSDRRNGPGRRKPPEPPGFGRDPGDVGGATPFCAPHESMNSIMSDISDTDRSDDDCPIGIKP